MHPASDTTRDQRRLALVNLLRQEPLRSQAECVERLAALGFTVNQATLSRDLRDLGVRKGPTGYELLEAPAREGSQLAHAVAEWLLTATAAQNQVVLKTPPSGAQPLAFAIDHTDLDGVVGTLAGDDTILVICSSATAAQHTTKELLALRPASSGQNGARP